MYQLRISKDFIQPASSFQLNKSLEKCMASVNSGLVKHNLLLGLDDRGKISCHKVNLCFLFFDNTNCVVSQLPCS